MTTITFPDGVAIWHSTGNSRVIVVDAINDNTIQIIDFEKTAHALKAEINGKTIWKFIHYSKGNDQELLKVIIDHNKTGQNLQS